METHGVSNATIPTSKTTGWRVGTVTQIIPEAIGLRSYTFRFDEPIKHEAGQHYELRLTAEDGYQAARLYSAAMPANGSANMLQLTIALMPYGEISPYVFNNVSLGSQVEIRGPFGRHFMWTPDIKRPILLVGGGSGVVPLRAIRLAHQQAGATSPIHLLYSVESYNDMPYRYELFPREGDMPEDVTITFTGHGPAGWAGYARRIDTDMIRDVLKHFDEKPAVYVCGPTPMVEAVNQHLVAAGIDPADIKAERFGPTG
jgi:ferredoxin-NADP reductase